MFKYIIFFLFFLSSTFLIADPLKVIVSVAPTKYLLEKIAPNTLQIETFVPSGASPHDYEPTPRQLLNASHAKIWFQIGEGFEGKSLEAIRNSVEIVNLRDGLELLSNSCCSQHDNHDPHIWLSTQLLKTQAEHIYKVLIRHFPEKKEEFFANLQALIKDLNEIDCHIKTVLANNAKKKILVSHPAFGYFCKDYGLTQLSIEVDGKEPCPKQMTFLLQELKKEKIKRIFLEPQHNAKAGLRFAEELQLQVVWLDPYQENVCANLKTIADNFAS